MENALLEDRNVAVVSSNSVDGSCVRDFGMCIERGHDSGVAETVAVNDKGVGIYCPGLVKLAKAIAKGNEGVVCSSGSVVKVRGGANQLCQASR